MDRTQLLEALRALAPALFAGDGAARIEALSDVALQELVRAWQASTAREAIIDGSLDERIGLVNRAVRQAYPSPSGDREVWARVVYLDRVIFERRGKLFAQAYTLTAEGEVVLGGEAVEVRIAYTPVQEAVGAAVVRDGWIVGPVREGAADPTGAEWDVIVIQAGLSANRNLYERAVLEAAAPKYEGVRIYMDHQEEPRRFGRSTRDLAGFLRGVQPVLLAQEAAGTPIFALAATACITKKWVREELLEAHRLGKPDLYGLSHDVRARSQAMVLPDGPAVKVDAIERVESVDFVTNPAAGGRVVRLVASDTPAPILKEDGQMLEKLLAQLRALNRPDLLELLGTAPTEDQVLEALAKALAAAPAKTDEKPAPPATPPPASSLTEAERADIREAKRTIAELRVARDLAECALPDKLKERLRKRFEARMAAGQIPSQPEITAAIAEAVEDFGALAEAGVVLPHVGVRRAEVTKATQDKVKEALDDFFNPEKPARSFRSLYVDITGDSKFTGKLSEAKRLSESLDSTSFDQALGDSITRRMLATYASPEFANWRKIASVTSLNDFRTQRRVRFGGYGNLPIVGQGGPYTALTSPTDEEATYSPAKRGGTESITLEMIRNDDVGAIREIPRRLGRAAAQTLYEFVWDFLANNSAIYDGTALAASSGHVNLVSTAMSATNIASLRLKMKNQTDISSGKRLGLKAKHLIVPNDLEELAFQLTSALKAMPDSSITATAEPAAPNFIRERIRLEVEVVDYWTDTNNYWLAASPDQAPMIEVGFLDGNEQPEVFVQDMPNVGSMFNNDQLTWKVRHIYGGAVMDYRGFAAGIVA